ncbi:MAG: F0F1 ATP synthase subunit gamma [Phycisphaeraceae bacterium]|nr:F0F1 ATP synthase subunit gamma [Phycisphaeraceae bacterium]
MSRRREREDHLRALDDIRGILRAMRNLAWLETRKLMRFLETQRRVIESMEAAAGDFFAYHPGALRRAPAVRPVFLLIGSERGFCGDFNVAIRESYHQLLSPSQPEVPTVLAVGRKLQSTLGALGPPRISVDGATAAEEIQDVLGRIMDALLEHAAHTGQFSLLDLIVIRRRPTAHGIETQTDPPFHSFGGAAPRGSSPPRLYLPPQTFLTELIEQFVPARLHELIYDSLLAENMTRIQHMERALRHLEDNLEQARRQWHSSRQEEITEEIEVILLSTEAMRAAAPFRDRDAPASAE